MLASKMWPVQQGHWLCNGGDRTINNCCPANFAIHDEGKSTMSVLRESGHLCPNQCRLQPKIVQHALASRALRAKIDCAAAAHQRGTVRQQCFCERMDASAQAVLTAGFSCRQLLHGVMDRARTAAVMLLPLSCPAASVLFWMQSPQQSFLQLSTCRVCS